MVSGIWRNSVNPKSKKTTKQNKTKNKRQRKKILGKRILWRIQMINKRNCQQDQGNMVAQKTSEKGNKLLNCFFPKPMYISVLSVLDTDFTNESRFQFLGGNLKFLLVTERIRYKNESRISRVKKSKGILWRLANMTYIWRSPVCSLVETLGLLYTTRIHM